MTIVESGDSRKVRFDLVTAGHQFLLNALPFRHPESLDALTTFISAAKRCRLSPFESDAILLRCLRVINRHMGGTVPSLIDRYITDASSLGNCLESFGRCVEDVFRYRGLGDGRVRQAVGVITTSYHQAALTPSSIADAVKVRLPTLCTAFKQQTGLSLSEYIREVRLQRAARLLTTTDMSIKEVWASTGYNHASNFDHAFKQRFMVTPREYRARNVPLALAPSPDVETGSRDEGSPGSFSKERVMVVDDDENTRTTVALYLRRQGYGAIAVSTGVEALAEIERARPDVILLDYRLGDMDGLECLARAPAAPRGRPARGDALDG
jgi:AraC-like DNA-binding protein